MVPAEGVFVKVSRDTSKQTMFVLSLSTEQQASTTAVMAGAVFGSARVRSAIGAEDNFGNANVYSFSLLLDDVPACGVVDFQGRAKFRKWLQGIPEFAMRSAILPLLPNAARFRKSKHQEKQDAVLDSISSMSSKNVAIMLKAYKAARTTRLLSTLRTALRARNQRKRLHHELEKKVYDTDVFDDEGTFRQGVTSATAVFPTTKTPSRAETSPLCCSEPSFA